MPCGFLDDNDLPVPKSKDERIAELEAFVSRCSKQEWDLISTEARAALRAIRSEAAALTKSAT